MNYLLYLQNFRNATGGFWDDFFLFLSQLNESFITYLLLGMIYWCQDKRIGRLMAINVSTSCWCNQWIKRIFKIERPWVVDYRLSPVKEAIDSATGYAMPSGGTQRAFANWGILACYTRRKFVRILCIIILVLVSFSGNYLGTLTLADELVAFAIGLLFMQLSSFINRFVFETEHSIIEDLFAIFLFLIIFLSPMKKFGCLSNAGTSIGIIIGLFLEKRFVKFSEPSSNRRILSRFFPGAIIVFLLYQYLPFLLVFIVPIGYERFIVNILIGLFITFFYPLVFVAWEMKLHRRVLVYCIGLIFSTGLIIGFINYERYASYKRDNSIIVADGGYSSIAPANTSAAINKAVDIGADYIKLDVQNTKDNVPVIFSNELIWSISDKGGRISDYTVEELKTLDMSKSFDGGSSSLSYTDLIKNYRELQILTLDEALNLVEGQNVNVILNIIDYNQDFYVDVKYVKHIQKVVKSHLLLNDVVYEADNPRTLKYVRQFDTGAIVMNRITSGSVFSAIGKNRSQMYSISVDRLTSSDVEMIHSAGAKCFADKVNTPEQMRYVQQIGVDGIFTKHVGIGRVVMKSEYSFMGDNYISSMTIPKLYDLTGQKKYKNYVLQGMTRVDDFVLLSAYDGAHRQNSVIFVLNANGRLCRVFDIGFKAHLGGIAYDTMNDILWTTAASGQVYAIDWGMLCRDGIVDIVYKFDAALYNSSSEHVASFLTIDDNMLYVGSYCEGIDGMLNAYNIDELLQKNNKTPMLKYSIPERIQGVAFYHSPKQRYTEIVFTQSDGYKQSNLLSCRFNPNNLDYSAYENKITLAGMVEQPVFEENSIYLVFESAAKKYRVSYRIPNDQVWKLRYK